MTEEASDPLTPKQARFVQEYLVDLNGTQAAIRAGYSAKTAEVQASRLLSKAKVQEAVAKGQGERAERVEITQDMVLRELWAIAMADPNEIVQYRRGACQSCWGEPAPAIAEGQEPQPHGGSLKRARKLDVLAGIAGDEEPNPECETCGGEGMGRAWVADTRKLNGAVRKLYAGVKVTKEGIEVKMHDKAAALVNVGKHLGMFKDKVELTGKDGGAIKTESDTTLDLTGATLEQLQAIATLRIPATNRG